MLQDVKSWLGKCFAMKELGEAVYILRIKIYRDRSRSKTQGPFTPAAMKRMKGVPYVSVVGSIIYAMRCTRPETVRDDLRSQTDYVFMMNGDSVEWKSSEQSTAMSSTEVEYIASSKAAMEAIWICKFIYGLGVVPSNDLPMDM
ncbi:hypothetical protein Tco_0875478 [Tanacetum coccineum]|uniref:Reverse transcriptase Ty1/copia-type domain-containing protein n=1 Tax=Tanacetum coccineum TaxID=301880 RepID=A0ABQ5BSF6_9ASTR